MLCGQVLLRQVLFVARVAASEEAEDVVKINEEILYEAIVLK